MNRIAKSSALLTSVRSASRPPKSSGGALNAIAPITLAFGVGYIMTNQELVREYLGYGKKEDKFRDVSNKIQSHQNFQRLTNENNNNENKDQAAEKNEASSEHVEVSQTVESTVDDTQEPITERPSRDFEDFEEQETESSVESKPEAQEKELATIAEVVPIPSDQIDIIPESETDVIISDESVPLNETCTQCPEASEPADVEEITVQVEEITVDEIPTETSQPVEEIESDAVIVSTEVADEVVELIQEIGETVSEPISELVSEANVQPTLEEQIGGFSRVAAQNTEDLILSYERAARSIIEFIKAKKYAFGFKGETDRKVAIWLQVAEYQNEMDKCIQMAVDVKDGAEKSLEELSNFIIKSNLQNWMGIDEEIQSMKSRIENATDSLNSAKLNLDKFHQIEEEVESAMEPKRRELNEIFGDSGDTEDDWKLLNPKFSQDDLKGLDSLKGLIFMAQKKIEGYNAELAHLRENQEKITSEALQKQRDAIMEETQAKIDALEILQNEKVEARRNEIRTQLLDEHEADLELQLKRQAAAHSLHLSEELSLQESALREKYNARIENQVNAVAVKYSQQIEEERSLLKSEIDKQENLNTRITTELRGYLEGINATIQERTKTEQEVTQLQTLSVGVERLKRAICDDKTTPLGSLISDLLKIRSEVELLGPVLNAIPTVASERGVINNNTLRKSFDDLKSAALVKHAVNSDLHGFFQELRSKFTYKLHGWLAQDSVANLEDIFNQAEAHMNVNDFETAVRILNQMSGEPKRVFGQWIEEARMWLEVKQALDVLVTMSEVRALSVRCLS